VQNYLEGKEQRWRLQPFQMRRCAAELREPDPDLQMGEKLRRDRLAKQLELLARRVDAEEHRVQAARLRKLVPTEQERFRAGLLVEAARHERCADVLEQELSRIRAGDLAHVEAE
jgi:hypothetical protein